MERNDGCHLRQESASKAESEDLPDSDIKPTMLYGAECWAMRKKEEHLLNKTEMRMLHWIQGISLKDHVRSEEIRNRLNVMPIVDQVTKRRLSWYGHVL